MNENGNDQIAVVIPCYNEEKTIGRVIESVRKHLPEAALYVFDNNSTDRTSSIALEKGAEVVPVRRQGKGFAVKAILQKVDAGIYLIVDGDDTYELSGVSEMVAAVRSGECDMAVGARMRNHMHGAFPRFHMLGNSMVCGLIRRLFDCELTDVMSGLRIFSEDVAKNVPLVAKGFEVETEWTIQLLTHGYFIKEFAVEYRARREGSHSKLKTFPDGFKVLWTIFKMFKDIKPLTFFGTIALLFFLPAMVTWLDVFRSEHFAGQGFWSIKAVQSLGFFLTGLFCTGLGILLNSSAEKHNQILAVLRRK